MNRKPNESKRINLGIIGCGAMGKGLVYQSTVTPGVACVAIADIDIAKCMAFLERLDLPYTVTDTPDQIHDAVRKGKIAVADNGHLITAAAEIDTVIESSNAILEAGEYAVEALNNRKHLVLMNSEIDLIFGPYFAQLAKQNDVIYTSCDGDQYGVIKHLIDEMLGWGFEVVMAGNIKGFLDRRANPTTIIPEADKRNLDYKMCTSYTDGTKLNIEMAIIANACGLKAPTPGMYGPRAAHVNEVFQKFNFDQLWKDREPVVDYILGAEPGGGVFTVGYCDNSYQQEMLAYYKMGQGPYYLFYRPYHLCHIESLTSIIKAVTEDKPLLQPDFGFLTNVFAYAKRDLRQGEVLDGIGGYACYGLIENCQRETEVMGLPICLAENVRLKRDIPKDEKINMADVVYSPERSDFSLYNKALQISNGSKVCI